MNFMQSFRNIKINGLNKTKNASSLRKYTQSDMLFAIVVVLLILFVLVHLVVSFILFLGAFPFAYSLTELLINYQGGFVRRGLIGEILWLTKDILDIKITSILFVYTCFVLYLFTLYRMFKRIYNKYIILFLCASPALIFFSPYNLLALYNKDFFILLTILFQFNCISLYIQHKWTTLKTYTCIFILFSIGILAHEILIFYTLFPALLLWQEEYKRKRGLMGFVLIAVVITLTSFFIYVNFGTAEQRDIIVQSWETFFHLKNGEFNRGAFKWLPMRFNDVWPILQEGYLSFSDLFFVFLTMFLGAIPIIFLYYIYNIKNSIKQYFTIPFYTFFIAIAFLSPLSLFFLMLDHGRVIYFALMYYLFFFSTVREICPQKVIPQSSLFYNICRKKHIQYGIFLLALSYAFLWLACSSNNISVLQFSYPMYTVLKLLGLM